MKIVRFGVSLPESLIKRFDSLIRRKNYSNRSEAIRDLIRRELVEEEISSNEKVIGKNLSKIFTLTGSKRYNDLKG